jgi:hypothetical protein
VDSAVEAVIYLLLEFGEITLVDLVSNGKHTMVTKMDHATIHEVGHNVLELELQCVWVHGVILNVVIFYNLEHIGLFVDGDETIALNGMVISPLLPVLFLIELLFEELHNI